MVRNSPRKEWRFAADLMWDDKKVTDTVGGFHKEGQSFTRLENKVRRRLSAQQEDYGVV